MALKDERILIFLDSDILKARRLAREMAAATGFDQVASAVIETVVSELATNLIKHRAVDGEIALLRLVDAERRGIEVRSLDRGPGIGNVQEALHGGVSSAGGLGIGLSGVKRFMDEFSLESRPHQGTTIIARKWLGTEESRRMSFSVIARPHPGEEVSGDAHFIRQTPACAFFAVTDALGHGREAFETSRQALAVLEDVCEEPLPGIVDLCHRELKGTRGAAMALCRIDFAEGLLHHLSIGNVETRVYGTREPVRPLCFNGTVGMSMENHHVRTYPWNDGATIVIFSDGVSGHFDLPPETLGASPQTIARYIFDRFARNYDDATVLVGR